MILEEYTIENTKIKFYDNYIVKDIAIQKEYIDNIIFNLINKITPYNCNLYNSQYKTTIYKEE